MIIYKVYQKAISGPYTGSPDSKSVIRAMVTARATVYFFVSTTQYQLFTKHIHTVFSVSSKVI